MKAWQLIENPKAWTKRADARDKWSHRISPENPRACKWCARGALVKCYTEPSDYRAAIAKLGNVHIYASTTDWNDEPCRTHAQVLAAMKKADV